MNMYWTYLMTNSRNTTIYTGMTNNLEKRVKDHKGKLNSGFTAKYNCDKLVYFEKYYHAMDAINREKQIKGGSRQKKIDMINKDNPDWLDLSADWD